MSSSLNASFGFRPVTPPQATVTHGGRPACCWILCAMACRCSRRRSLSERHTATAATLPSKSDRVHSKIYHTQSLFCAHAISYHVMYMTKRHDFFLQMPCVLAIQLRVRAPYGPLRLHLSHSERWNNAPAPRARRFCTSPMLTPCSIPQGRQKATPCGFFKDDGYPGEARGDPLAVSLLRMTDTPERWSTTAISLVALGIQNNKIE